MKKNIVILFVLLTVTGSLCFPAALDKELSISLELKQVENLTTTSLSYVFYLNIKNVSSKEYYLARYRYRFVVDEREYIQINTVLPQGLEIKPSVTTMVAVPVKITYEHLFQALEGIREMDSASCYLMGELFFSDDKKERGSLPIAFNGEFPIFRAPEVEIVSLYAKGVSIGGADLEFSARFKNSNGFTLRVHEISYSLKLGGFPVDEGRIEGDKNIETRDERLFLIHLLLNFFDVGKDLYPVLQNSEVEAEFDGEIGILTNWGRLRIPFSLKSRLPISKTGVNPNSTLR